MTDPVTHYRACNLCEAICGLEIRVADGRIVSIKGDAQDPFSRGHTCPKAVALQDLQNDPDRLRQPMRRVGTSWEPISWDEAFALVAQRLADIRERHGNDAIAVYQGNPGCHHYGVMTHASNTLRHVETRNSFSATSTDQLPHYLATWLMYGHQYLVPIPDIDHTEHFLILGGNPLASNGSLMTVPDVANRLKALRQRGGRLVVVDPRRTETAEVADEHHFIRPGTDAALLAALLQTLFAERLARPGRLADLLDGFDEVAAAIAAFTPERAAAVTDIPAPEIRRLAREFAAAERAVCYGRIGACAQVHGSLCQWLVQLLNIATGNLDRVGGSLVTLPAWDLVAATASSPGGYGRWKSRVSGRPEVCGELPAVVMAEEMLTPGPGQVRALISIAGNPVLSTPNGRQLDTALAGLDFMVAVDLYINETTRHADVILPTTTTLEHEHYDILFNAFAVRNVARYNPAVLPRPEGALHDWEVFQRLGEALGQRLQRPSRKPVAPEALLDRIVKGGPYGVGAHRLTLDKLKASPHGIDLGPLQPSFPQRLRTPDQRIRCAPPPLMAALREAEGALLAPPEPGGLLLIGRRHVRSNNSWMHNYRRLVKGRDRCNLLMHPDDLSRHGLADGQRVRVRSRVGSVEVAVAASAEMMRGVVSLPHGWGHDRPGVRLATAQEHAGVSVNDLTDEALCDAVSGNAAHNGVPVTVEAA